MLQVLADIVVVVHFVFIAFVVLGGLLAVKFPWVALLHLPAAVWGALIELAGFGCPLTPLENRLRRAADGEAYEEGFIEHYVLPIIYPGDLTREVQLGLAFAVVAINAVVYAFVVRQHRNRRRR